MTSPTLARWQWIALLGFALVVRSSFLAFAYHNLQADPDGYHRLANNLVHQGMLGDQVPIVRQNADGTWRVTRDLLPTAYRPPLYPLLLAVNIESGLKFRHAMALQQLVLGLLTVWLTVKVGQHLNLGRTSLLAGVLVACDPILLQQSSLVMTETLAVLLAVMAIGCLIRCTKCNSSESPPRNWMRFALAGVVLSLAALCRPTFLLMIPLAGCWLWFQVPKSSNRFLAATVYLVSAMLVLAPWVARNTMIFGKPIVATTHGGYTFHLANNPGFYHYLRTAPWGKVWNSTDNFRLHANSVLTLNMIDYPERRLPEFATNSPNFSSQFSSDEQQELLLDKLHYADAWSAIRDEPGMFAYSILVRLGRLWQPLPHRTAVPNKLRQGDELSQEDDANESPESLRSSIPRYSVAIWYVGVYVLAGIGLWSLGWQLWRSPWCWGTLLVVAFMSLHAFYWTDMRMRAPLVPVVCWWAAAGWNCYHSPRSARKA